MINNWLELSGKTEKNTKDIAVHDQMISDISDKADVAMGAAAVAQQIANNAMNQVEALSESITSNMSSSLLGSNQPYFKVDSDGHYVIPDFGALSTEYSWSPLYQNLTDAVMMASKANVPLLLICMQETNQSVIELVNTPEFKNYFQNLKVVVCLITDRRVFDLMYAKYFEIALMYSDDMFNNTIVESDGDGYGSDNSQIRLPNTLINIDECSAMIASVYPFYENETKEEINDIINEADDLSYIGILPEGSFANVTQNLFCSNMTAWLQAIQHPISPLVVPFPSRNDSYVYWDVPGHTLFMQKLYSPDDRRTSNVDQLRLALDDSMFQSLMNIRQARKYQLLYGKTNMTNKDFWFGKVLTDNQLALAMALSWDSGRPLLLFSSKSTFDANEERYVEDSRASTFKRLTSNPKFKRMLKELGLVCCWTVDKQLPNGNWSGTFLERFNERTEDTSVLMSVYIPKYEDASVVTRMKDFNAANDSMVSFFTPGEGLSYGETCASFLEYFETPNILTRQIIEVVLAETIGDYDEYRLLYDLWSSESFEDFETKRDRLYKKLRNEIYLDARYDFTRNIYDYDATDIFDLIGQQNYDDAIEKIRFILSNIMFPNIRYPSLEFCTVELDDNFNEVNVDFIDEEFIFEYERPSIVEVPADTTEDDVEPDTGWDDYNESDSGGGLLSDKFARAKSEMIPILAIYASENCGPACTLFGVNVIDDPAFKSFYSSSQYRMILHTGGGFSELQAAIKASGVNKTPPSDALIGYAIYYLNASSAVKVKIPKASGALCYGFYTGSKLPATEEFIADLKSFFDNNIWTMETTIGFCGSWTAITPSRTYQQACNNFKL